MKTEKYIQYLPLSLIMIDHKMVNTNVFLNIMQPICARIYENTSPVFSICVCVYIHIYIYIPPPSYTQSFKRSLSFMFPHQNL